MKNIKLKQINKQFISGIMAGVITITLIGCSKEEKQYTNNVISVSSINELNKVKKINIRKTLALVNDNETLFVSYDNKDDLYVTDIFTNTKYRIYNGPFHNFFSSEATVKDVINDDIFIYDKEYKCQKINDYLPDSIGNLNKRNGYDKLTQFFLSTNNIDRRIFIEKDPEFISLENVIALTNGEEVLFAKYDNVCDQYITDIFNNKIYNVSSGYGNVINRFSSGIFIIKDDYYKVKSITTYPYIVENIIDGKISKSILRKSLKDANRGLKKTLVKQKN